MVHRASRGFLDVSFKAQAHVWRVWWRRVRGELRLRVSLVDVLYIIYIYISVLGLLLAGRDLQRMSGRYYSCRLAIELWTKQAVVEERRSSRAHQRKKRVEKRVCREDSGHEQP